METFLSVAESCLLTPKTKISFKDTYREYLYHFHRKESKKKWKLIINYTKWYVGISTAVL